MADDREHRIIEAFVELADSLASGYDAVDLLDRLAHSCVGVLDVAAAGLLLADDHGRLHVLAASSQAARELEVFQLQSDEGPCRDCYHSGTPVYVPALDEVTDRWPRFAPYAISAGFTSVHAVPLRLRSDTLGALGLFGTTVGALGDRDKALGQALADVATVALVQEHAAADREVVAQQLQAALNSRVALEQAKGVVAYVGDLGVNQAFDVLRRYARDHNLRLTEVAAGVVNRDLTAQQVLAHARARSPVT
ncbi:GAF and ANTAR domain-containing protein [Cellulomonas aerilata]|uniref:Transcriptional regulator n=1 Tax=Cellulomonas aerilata TaxID=515326 RepID=A0A512DBY5_9CELL|nr:GAF and ANTAR domain-containing protein [Cellulomonas aerilata]GEO33973.1 transcriptional regulator [Cellulomonas aerilata]